MSTKRQVGRPVEGDENIRRATLEELRAHYDAGELEPDGDDAEEQAEELPEGFWESAVVVAPQAHAGDRFAGAFEDAQSNHPEIPESCRERSAAEFEDALATAIVEGSGWVEISQGAEGDVQIRKVQP